MGKEPWVDREECIGCGTCVEDCPEVFRLDNDDKSECYNPSGATEEAIQTAMDDCPVQCIHWRDQE